MTDTKINSAALANVDAERSILGAILLDNVAFHEAAPYLSLEDFSLDSHRRIYMRMSQLIDTGNPVDMITLINSLEAGKDLGPVGGVGYVSGLTVGVPDRPSIEHYVKIVIDRSRRRRVMYAATTALDQANDPGVETSELLQGIQESLLQIEARSGTATARSAKEFLPDVLADLQKQAANAGLLGYGFGIPGLDAFTGGIRKKELCVIGALPGRGKTALALQTILTNASIKIPSCAFSLEMSEGQVGRRMFAARSTLSAQQIRNPRRIYGERWTELARCAAEMSKWPLYVDDRGSLKISELLASARLYRRRHSVEVFVIDYVRLIDCPGKEDRQRISYAANALRAFAKQEDVAVFLLSQLARPKNINDRPSMIQLKESGDLEAAAHVVLLPYFPLGDDNKFLPEQEIIVGKNREGMIGSVPVFLDERRLQFFDRVGEVKP